jgi:hypothetical protein
MRWGFDLDHDGSPADHSIVGVLFGFFDADLVVSEMVVVGDCAGPDVGSDRAVSHSPSQAWCAGFSHQVGQGPSGGSRVVTAGPF